MSSSGADDSARDIFANFNAESVQHIIDWQLRPKTWSQMMPQNGFGRIGEVLMYILRMGIISHVNKLWWMGAIGFQWDPVKVVTIDKEVVVKGLTVEPKNTDLNRHFTVREIVAASEIGYYRLVIENGLTHLEYYFGRTFFCSNLTCNFYKEIPLGAKYEQRAKIIDIKGPIFVVSVSFYDASDDLCFKVDWSLLLPMGAAKQVYDFEIGLTKEQIDSRPVTNASGSGSLLVGEDEAA